MGAAIAGMLGLGGAAYATEAACCVGRAACCACCVGSWLCKCLSSACKCLGPGRGGDARPDDGHAPAWGKPMSLLVVFASIALALWAQYGFAATAPWTNLETWTEGCDAHGDAFEAKCLGYAAGARLATPSARARRPGPRARARAALRPSL